MLSQQVLTQVTFEAMIESGHLVRSMCGYCMCPLLLTTTAPRVSFYQLSALPPPPPEQVQDM